MKERNHFFVSQLAVNQFVAVRRMGDSSRDACARLTRTILDLGAAPLLPRPDVRSADLHYQDLQHVLSRLGENVEARSRRYSLAAERLVGEPQAVALVANILERLKGDAGLIRESVTTKAPAAT